MALEPLVMALINYRANSIIFTLFIWIQFQQIQVCMWAGRRHSARVVSVCDL